MITEDTLLLYYYDELPPGERMEIDVALDADPALTSRYRDLCAALADWRGSAETPAPDEQKRRWHDSIDKMAKANAGRPRVRREGPRFWLFGIAAALTAALVAGVFIGTNLVEQPVPYVVPDTSSAGPDTYPAAVTPASFTRGLQQHLLASAAEVSRMAPGDSGRALLTMQLIQQNRMFERAAMQSNAQNLARVLRAFEPILLQLANEDIAPQDMEALRMQLAFELKVMLTKLETASSEDAHAT
jgi:hypothetical protein